MPTYANVILLSSQIRMARAALDWTIRELAEKSGISAKTIQRLEVAGSQYRTTVQTYTSLVRCFEAHDIVFVCAGDSELGPGVRLRSVSAGT